MKCVVLTLTVAGPGAHHEHPIRRAAGSARSCVTKTTAAALRWLPWQQRPQILRRVSLVRASGVPKGLCIASMSIGQAWAACVFIHRAMTAATATPLPERVRDHAEG